MADAPPKKSRPARLLGYPELADAVHHAYLHRNSAELKWADAEDSPLDPTEDADDDDS